HLFFGDLLWYMRLTSTISQFGFSYDQISALWNTESGEAWEKPIAMAQLQDYQMQMCEKWIQYVNSLQEAELEQEFVYKNT
ncbi:hypothetical protein, partial [Klebsiella pneumoniae]|uniref:hypothetical protein n=1 Tax=Klebsiella pneumoniae TaxID=573 RepID=UPI0027E43135